MIIQTFPKSVETSSSCPLNRESQALKVALVYSAFHSKGGVERVALQTANYLQSEGMSSTLFASQFPEKSELQEGVQCVRVRDWGLPFGLGLPSFQAAVRRVVKKNTFDVIAGFGVQSPEESVLWVQSVHAAWWEHCLDRRSGFIGFRQKCNPFHRTVLRLERNMFEKRRYRRVIALTNNVQEDLCRFYKVPAEDVDILPNGFHSKEFGLRLRDQFRNEVRARLGIPQVAWVVLFVANEWERKGLLYLFQALAMWRQSDVHLIVAGRLPRRLLSSMASRFGLSERVHFVGNQEPVNRWFGAADMFALPTLYEAWGMVIIEALASGIPVLTSARAGGAVAIRDGESGCVIEDPTDVDEILSGLIKIRNEVKMSPAEIAESCAPYEWSKIMKRYVGILKGVL